MWMAANSPDLPFDQESADYPRQGRLLDWQWPFGPEASISAADPQRSFGSFLQTSRWQEAPTGKLPLESEPQVANSTVSSAVVTATRIHFSKDKTRPFLRGSRIHRIAEAPAHDQRVQVRESSRPGHYLVISDQYFRIDPNESCLGHSA
jgi:hypothetical protein